MPIKIQCSSCGRTLKAPDTAAGKQVRCPACGTVSRLPEAPAEEVYEPQAVPEQPPADPFAQPQEQDPFNQAPYDPQQPPYDPNQGAYGVAQPPPYAAPYGAPGADAGGEARRPCPMCGEMIAQTAMKCRFCGSIFDPALRAAEERRKRGSSGGAGDEDMSTGEWIVAILCSGIGCIIGIVWMCQGKPKGKKMFGVSIMFVILWNIIRFAIESSRR